MKQDQLRWNKKYHVGGPPGKPSGIVKEYYKQAPPGRALDIAAGSGRNAIFLADQGFTVDALDISDRALSDLVRYPGVEPVCVDFDVFDLARDRYSLIVDVRFLCRRLFPQIMEALVWGGVLIFEAHLEILDPAGAGPNERAMHRREFMLRPNELLHAFIPLRIIHYREVIPDDGEEDRPLATLVAVKKNQWG